MGRRSLLDLTGRTAVGLLVDGSSVAPPPRFVLYCTKSVNIVHQSLSQVFRMCHSTAYRTVLQLNAMANAPNGSATERRLSVSR